MISHYKNVYTETHKQPKKNFKKRYGRKPTKEEIKLIRKGLIDVGPIPNYNVWKPIAEAIKSNQIYKIRGNE